MELRSRAGESPVHPEGARSAPEGPGARSRVTAEQGFTLAGVIVIMTIMMIVVAYTVPRMWSTVMKREREKQTLFAMQQYAKAIYEFQYKNKSYPTSIKQLQDARQPRMIRGGPKGEYLDPLSGEVDWLVIPQAAATSLPQCGGTNPNGTPGTQPPPPPPPPQTDTSGTNPKAPPGLPGVPIKDYAGGPFIGVRPAAKGKSLMMVCNADTYEMWLYTSLDYEREKKLRLDAAATVFH